MLNRLFQRLVAIHHTAQALPACIMGMLNRGVVARIVARNSARHNDARIVAIPQIDPHGHRLHILNALAHFRKGHFILALLFVLPESPRPQEASKVGRITDTLEQWKDRDALNNINLRHADTSKCCG